MSILIKKPRHKRMLIIEDNAADAELVMSLLSSIEPFDFEVCQRSTEALALLETESFDVALLDLMLPDADSLSGLFSLQNAAPELPIIVYSGDHDRSRAISAIQAGAQDFVLKSHLNGTLLARCIEFSIERKAAEISMRHQAHHDALTGLLNRSLLFDRIALGLESSKRYEKDMAILYIDLDGFKRANDNFGHAIGDQILVSVSRCLANCVRSVDTVARYGGDEFVIALLDLKCSTDAGLVAERILHSFQADEVLSVPGREISASIGIAVPPESGKTPELLIRNADKAMYAVKQEGGHAYKFHDRTVDALTLQRQHMGTEIQKALELNHFEMHYQPIVNVRSGEIQTFEALLRWNKPGQGCILPSTFLPDAEATRMILPLGEWVFETVCKQTQIWINQGLPVQKVAVNLSPYQLSTEAFANFLFSTLDKYKFPRNQLIFEVTETGIAVNRERILKTLTELHIRGIKIILDDFGTGPISFRNLKQYPIDAIKIHPSLFDQASQDVSSEEFVRGIVAAAHGLGKKVIAEGVEQPAQADFLEQIGCDLIQGFVYSPAITADRVPELLQQWNRQRSIKSSGAAS